MPNKYQTRKAKLIAGTLLLAAVQSDTPLAQLPLLAARMSHTQWVTVSLQSGVPVADHSARVMVVALLANLA